MDGSDPNDHRTFRVNFSGDGAARLRERVKEKLKEYMGDYTDDTLVEYVIVLLRNGRHKEEAERELNVFLGDDNASFVSWLWDHLSSSLHLYVQTQESFPDEVIKTKPQLDKQSGRNSTQPEHLSSTFHSDSEHDREKSLKESRIRRNREWKGLVRDVAEPPPLQGTEIDKFQSEEKIRRLPGRMQRSRSPRPGHKKRSRQDERQPMKREVTSHPTIDAPRRLLQFAVRDAVGTPRTISSRPEPALKRLRSVVSTSTGDSSLDDRSQRTRSVTRMPHPAATAIKAAAEAAEDVVKFRCAGNVFDRLGRGMAISEATSQPLELREPTHEDAEYEDFDQMPGVTHAEYLQRSEYSGGFEGDTTMIDRNTGLASDSASDNDGYDDPGIVRGRVIDASQSASSGQKDGNSLMVQYSVATQSQIQTLHAHIIKTGLAHNDLVLGQLLLCCSSLSNSLEYARRLFDAIPHPSPFFYNAMIKGYSENGAHDQALRLYSLMRAQSVPCDSFTFPVVLRSSSSLASIEVGQELHGLVLKMGFGLRVIVQTALIDMYCACGLSDYGRRVFDGTRERDVICWNTMIAGYVKCGEFGSARQLFDQMPERNISSWNTLLDMYCKCGDVEMARTLFDEMQERDIISWNVMISGYAKIGESVAARGIFDEMPKRNVVSWNVVITCYMHNRCFAEALELFRMMQASDIRPNEVTVMAVLPACAHMGALDVGQWIHGYISRYRIKMDVYVNTALIDMYGKCGSVEDAQKVFDNAVNKDSFLCSTMIEVLAMHRKAEEAFEIFAYMKRVGMKLTDVTFVGLMKACSHAGLVDAGLKYFDMMSEFGLMPKVEHFGCMVDLLGRAGFLNEAHELIKSMPMEPPAVVWGALLNACRMHGNVKLAEEIALRLIELEPQSCGNYVLLSNIYSKASRWDDAARVRKLMKEKGVMKKPGCSSIEVNNSVHEFFAGDGAHPYREEIYKMLDQMAHRLKKEGYVPCTSSALHAVSMDEKEQALIHHSEKLAVAFGLISTGQGTPIRIVKNLRVCEDCHLFMKLVSKYYRRQMIVRDCNRFHHFRDGSCSCSDYW